MAIELIITNVNGACSCCNKYLLFRDLKNIHETFGRALNVTTKIGGLVNAEIDNETISELIEWLIKNLAGTKNEKNRYAKIEKNS